MILEKLQYFVGKICTIHVDALSQSLSPKQMFTYFTGYVKWLDEFGIIIERTTGPFDTFIKMSNVVAITEEEVEQLDPDNPKDAEVIKAVQATQQVTQPTLPPGEFVSPEALGQVSQAMKDLAKSQQK